MSPAIKQDDIQRVGVFLATEFPYELASETHQRCTGAEFSSHSLHEAVNRVAEELDILEVKGFRLYLLDDQRIEHVMSWHQMGSCHDLAGALRTIKEAGLIPEEEVRLCMVADGADRWVNSS